MSCSRPDVLPKARRSAQGQTSCSRPDVLLKARCSAQGQTSCSRPDALLKTRLPVQGPTSCSRPDILPKALCSAQGPTPHSRPDTLPVFHLTPDILPDHCRASARRRSSAGLLTNTRTSNTIENKRFLAVAAIAVNLSLSPPIAVIFSVEHLPHRHCHHKLSRITLSPLVKLFGPPIENSSCNYSNLINHAVPFERFRRFRG
ncbi:hypothetical protein M5K25_007414 [Dendrobium thyrsiflorum]|uniref:Uncharacterized protein n=1 Tax=Dendrobium thyrsiflorum TaxID=117978 RepID=A0ABD0VFA4_DENTH